MSFYFRFFETFCEHAPQNKLRRSTNFIIFGLSNQKLWRNKILGEVWARQASIGANQQDLATYAKRSGQEEKGKFCKGGVTGTCIGKVDDYWLPTTGWMKLAGNRSPQSNRLGAALLPPFSNFFVFLNLIFCIMKKFGDGLGILEEWMYNTPIFEPCPYTWKGEIFHSS
jgi:hypothetical protein